MIDALIDLDELFCASNTFTGSKMPGIMQGQLVTASQTCAAQIARYQTDWKCIDCKNQRPLVRKQSCELTFNEYPDETQPNAPCRQMLIIMSFLSTILSCFDFDWIAVYFDSWLHKRIVISIYTIAVNIHVSVWFTRSTLVGWTLSGYAWFIFKYRFVLFKEIQMYTIFNLFAFIYSEFIWSADTSKCVRICTNIRLLPGTTLPHTRHSCFFSKIPCSICRCRRKYMPSMKVSSQPSMLHLCGRWPV